VFYVQKGAFDKHIHVIMSRIWQAHSQHLLALCDTCNHHYHLACLDPPLKKMPHKSARFLWECSNCACATSDSASGDDETAPTTATVIRRPRLRRSDAAVPILNGHVKPGRKRAVSRVPGRNIIVCTPQESQISDKSSSKLSPPPRLKRMSTAKQSPYDFNDDD
jgi:hypothetical protein